MLWLYRTRIFAVIAALAAVAVFVRIGAGPSVFERAVSAVFKLTGRTAENTLLPYGDKEQLKKELAAEKKARAELQRRNAFLESEIERMNFTGTESRPPESIAARVTDRDPASWMRRVSIGAGMHSGVRKGFIAMTGDGLAGRATACGHSSCSVMLLTDPGSAVSCLIKPSNRNSGGQPAKPAYCIAYGNAGDRLDVVVIAGGTAPAGGDRIYTSGLGGAYPEGLLIGTLSGEKKHGVFYAHGLEAVPAANFNGLKYLYMSRP